MITRSLSRSARCVAHAMHPLNQYKFVNKNLYKIGSFQDSGHSSKFHLRNHSQKLPTL